MAVVRFPSSRQLLLATSVSAIAVAAFVAHADDRGAAAFRPDGPAGGFNTMGTPGLIEMPVAHSRDSGELAFNVSSFGGQHRVALTFQFSDRLSATFRYGILDQIQPDLTRPQVIDPYHDRSFSLQYRFVDEGRYRPAIAVGINDLVGTGLYGGEYVVASKTLTPELRASLGIGWGRLGSKGGFTNPLSIAGDRFKTRPDGWDGPGGDFDPGTWFHGDAALFGGVEWQVNDRLTLLAEYSSDAYLRESNAFERKSPLNFGLSWKSGENSTLSASYMYGSEIGLQYTYVMNPGRGKFGSGREAGPPAILPRSAAVASWGDVDQGNFGQVLHRDLSREGIRLEGFRAEGRTLRVEIRNDRYGTPTEAIGRTARILTRNAPAEVDRFDIVIVQNGMPVTRISQRRSDLENLEFRLNGTEQLWQASEITDPVGSPRAPRLAGSYPVLKYGIEPYLTPSYFDPDSPVRADAGIAVYGRYEPLPGIVFAGRVQHRLIGNLDDIARVSNSVLPHVRSDAEKYFKDGNTTLVNLTGAYYFRPAPNTYGRITAGYLESMFGGVSAEMLWKPQAANLALGLELNHVRQRDFDQKFGFQDYKVTTGHASAYYTFGEGYLAQLDVGRYLAGDVGGTLSLTREFANGWKVGAFATKTDVSAKDFGEGSFDKGITLTIPLDWVTGLSSQTRYSTTIRPTQRDGGQRVVVPGRLYDTVREVQASELENSWGRFWK